MSVKKAILIIGCMGFSDSFKKAIEKQQGIILIDDKKKIPTLELSPIHFEPLQINEFKHPIAKSKFMGKPVKNFRKK